MEFANFWCIFFFRGNGVYKVYLNVFMLIVFNVVEIIRFFYLEITSRKFENKNTCVRTSYSHYIAPVQNYSNSTKSYIQCCQSRDYIQCHG